MGGKRRAGKTTSSVVIHLPQQDGLISCIGRPDAGKVSRTLASSVDIDMILKAVGLVAWVFHSLDYVGGYRCT